MNSIPADSKRALATFGKAFGLALHAGLPLTAVGTGRRPRPAMVAGPSIAAEANADVATTTPDSVGVKSSNGASIGQTLRADPARLSFPKLERVRDRDHLRHVASPPY